MEADMNLTTRTIDRRQFLSASALLLATPAIGALAGCGAAPAQSGQANGSSFNGQFIVGFDQDFPPYGYVGDNGEFTGFDLDLAKLVCEKENWTFQPEAIAWDSKDALLNSGQITCIWNGFTIEGREDDYTFTNAYMENRQVIVVAADSPIAKFADLKDKNVVTQADSAALELLSDGGDQADLGSTFAKLDTIGEYNTAFMMLEQGTYDAIAIDEPVAFFNIAGKEDKFRILDERLNSEHYGVGFAKGNEALAAEVEATLQELAADGTVAATAEKYADQGISMDNWCLPKA
jgi:polar amino acid transport system substrate-binding protein